ncbi:MAG: tetratricopeptide repeat protein [Gallionella sp.]|nr:tetratricopeptide repeat protein [Gallionella sp.]
MNIITMKPRYLPKPAIGLFFGVLTAASGVCAQEAGQKTLQPMESVASNPSDSYEALLHDAGALIGSGKPGAAYNLLEPLEFEYAGEARFDYLIGIAALDSGKPDKATLAFERVLAVNPDSAAARLDMARAYYQLGDFPRARTEFTAALKQNTSAATRANIQKYLDAIAAQKDGKRTRFSGYVEVEVGRDSNVNNSTSQSQVFVDLFATMATLDPANVKASDNYYAAAAGGEINHSLNAHWGLYAGADLRKHANRTHTQFDSVNTDVRAGVVYEAQANRLRVGAVGGQYDLGGARNIDTTGIKAEFRHVFSPSNQLNAFAQSVQYRYADPLMQPNDIDQQAAGLGWLHVLADGKSSLSGSAHYGTEKDVAPVVTVPSIGIINPGGGRNDGAKRFSGLRVGGQTALGERTTLFASAGMQIGDYGKVNYLFLRQRKDRLYDLKLGAAWHWDKLWTLRPQLNYSRNDSNIAIYGYDRMDISLTVRREFR